MLLERCPILFLHIKQSICFSARHAIQLHLVQHLTFLNRSQKVCPPFLRTIKKAAALVKLSGGWQLDRNELAAKDRSQRCSFKTFIFMTWQELQKHNNKSNNKRLEIVWIGWRKKWGGIHSWWITRTPYHWLGFAVPLLKKEGGGGPLISGKAASDL